MKLVAGIFLGASLAMASPTAAEAPVRLAILRLTHDHVFWLLDRARDAEAFEIVGIYEPNEELAAERAAQFGIDSSLLYTDLDRLLEDAQPEAACLFGSVREHHPHTLACVERGVHVMVEKPLARTFDEGLAMAEAAQRAGVALLTNYETTGYANLHAMRAQIARGELGQVRRVVFRIGHRGPVEIGCRQVFLDWLLDPNENGGGALTDFGCYGANLATWLLDDQRPESVMAITQQLKPEIYSQVDDDATILLTYAKTIVVIQASWNWPDSVKQTTTYGEQGRLRTFGSDRLTLRRGDEAEKSLAPPDAPPASYADPFDHLTEVVRRRAEPNPLAAVENNLLVMEILDAARKSAATGRRVMLP